MLNVLFLHSRWHAGNYPMTKDPISNYRTKVLLKVTKNASSPVNRACGRIPRIPPESATDVGLPHVGLLLKKKLTILVGKVYLYFLV